MKANTVTTMKRRFKAARPFRTRGGLDNWLETARRWADYTQQAVADGHEHHSGQYAHNAATFYRWHLEGR